MMMTARRLATVFLLAVILGLCAGEAQRGPSTISSAPGEPRTMFLWEAGAPGAVGTEDADRPTLTYYPPARDTSDTAVIVAPGGSYRNLSLNLEGRQPANWLNALGVKAFVLTYRLGPRYRHPIELGDAKRAIRLVRSRAAEFGVSQARVGMMGFSAGGHLASSAGALSDSGNPSADDPVDRASSRPDFLVLVYPVILFTGPYAHQGSIASLLGDHPDPKLLDELSTDRRVTEQTPPTFLFSTSEDTSVAPENSVAFYLALHKAGVPTELHIFQNGEHGAGLGLTDPALGEWPALLAQWLRGRGLLGKAAP
jgi:acetyl esterase/lipase